MYAKSRIWKIGVSTSVGTNTHGLRKPNSAR
jgi:hypothetical protein